MTDTKQLLLALESVLRDIYARMKSEEFDPSTEEVLVERMLDLYSAAKSNDREKLEGQLESFIAFAAERGYEMSATSPAMATRSATEDDASGENLCMDIATMTGMAIEDMRQYISK